MQPAPFPPKPDLSPRLSSVLDQLEKITNDIAGDEDMIGYLIETGELTPPPRDA